MFERVHHMLIKEFIQVFRDPRMRIVIFLIPCFQVMVIGYAVSTDVKHVRTAVYDLDNSQASRDVAARFVRSGYFDVVAAVGDERGRPRTARPQRRDRRAAIQPRLRRRSRRRPHRPAANPHRRHRLEHGRHRAELRGEDRHRLLRADCRRARGSRVRTGRQDGPRRSAHQGVVQRKPGKPQFLRARRAGRRRHAGHAAADQHGRRPRKGNRHDGADHGHADHACRVHSGQDDPFCHHRVRRRASRGADRRVLVRGADPRQPAAVVALPPGCT